MGERLADPARDETERAGLPIRAFATAAEWEAWLAGQPPDAAGLWLKLAKKGAGWRSLTRAQAVEGALCHGWIDGQGDRFDDTAWLVRFTPRRRSSTWSQVNRAAALALIAAGRMGPAGLAQVEAARADGRWARAYAPASRIAVPDDLAAALAAVPEAQAAFAGLDARNRYAILHRVQDARRPETRARRIAEFVAMLARGETLYPRGNGGS